MFFGETIGNPKINILDIEAVADVAHDNGVPLIVDNTIATPYLIRPFEFGADIVVHSATKFLGGHGTAIGGVIVDGGTFDWSRAAKFPGFTMPDPSYHGVVYTEPRGAGASRSRPACSCCATSARPSRRSTPSCSSRASRRCRCAWSGTWQNAQQVAEWLRTTTRSDSVNYPGLPSSRGTPRSRSTRPKGAGAVLAFELKGGVEAGQKFVDALELFSHLANIGDVRSLVIHPASTTHSQLTAEEQLTTGVTPGLVRLSVGLEDIDDINADLEAGFRAAKARLTMGGWVEAGPGRATAGLPRPARPLPARARRRLLPTVRVAYETWGTLAAGRRQRRAGAARAHRRQPRRRPGRPGAPDAGLVGRA